MDAPYSAKSRPLDGLRVVETTSFVAGPLAGMTLAQLGAEVIRLDPASGPADAGRWPLNLDGHSLFWAGLNKGVRSVALDFGSPRGQELAAALITAPGEEAGLFVDNTIGRDFLSYEALSRRRADLIHVHIQGHPDGRPAMDYAVNPLYGVPMLTRQVDSDRPVNHVLPAWDIATGLLAVSGLLAGLHRRMLDGVGSQIDLALADVAAAHVAHLGWLAEAAERGRDRPRLGNHMFGAFGVDFACADDRRVIAVAITRQQWRDLVRLTGTEAVFDALAESTGADLSIEGQRFEHRAIIEAVLAPWFSARTAAEVLAAAEGTRVMVGEFRSPKEVVDAFHRGEESPVLLEVQQGSAPMLTGTSPLRWDRTYAAARPAPAFGADTEWALADVLGLTDHEIGRLADDGVVRTTTTASVHHPTNGTR